MGSIWQKKLLIQHHKAPSITTYKSVDFRYEIPLVLLRNKSLFLKNFRFSFRLNADSPQIFYNSQCGLYIITYIQIILITSLRVSKKDYSWETKVYVPKLRLEGQYKMAGKILLIPLNGAGHMFIEIGKKFAFT